MKVKSQKVNSQCSRVKDRGKNQGLKIKGRRSRSGFKGHGSRVTGRGSRVKGQGFRVLGQGSKSWVLGQGSRVKSQG